MEICSVSSCTCTIHPTPMRLPIHTCTYSLTKAACVLLIFILFPSLSDTIESFRRCGWQPVAELAFLTAARPRNHRVLSVNEMLSQHHRSWPRAGLYSPNATTTHTARRPVFISRHVYKVPIKRHPRQRRRQVDWRGGDNGARRLQNRGRLEQSSRGGCIFFKYLRYWICVIALLPH